MGNSESTFSFMLKLLTKHLFFAIVTFLTAIAASISSVLASLQIGKSIDKIISKGNVDYAGLYQILITLTVLYVVGAASSWLVSALSSRVAYIVAKDLRNQVFEKLEKLPLSFFDRNPHGDIISRFTNDIDNISTALSLALASFCTGLITVISIICIMLYSNTILASIVLILTPISFLLARFIANKSQRNFQRQQELVGELTGYVTEIVGNQKTVQALGHQEQCVKDFNVINNELNKVGRSAQFSSAMINPSARMMDHFSYVVVGVVGGFMAIINPALSVGTISTFLIYTGQFAKPFNEISGIMANIQTAIASAKRIQSTLREKEELSDSPNSTVLDRPKGIIEFKDVNFSYNNKTPLITDLNIFADTGSLVAIVGPTGAGKTTIVNLLMRFYEVNSGAIIIDGQNITEIQKDSLRRSFGMVLQETWLFNGTIKENIAYGMHNATDEDIIAAAKSSHAHSFITRMPQGYDTIVMEDGGNLSQGQKQLLTIARVMLSNPSMLILDEATSYIDTLTEIRVQEAFLKLMNGRTSFVIAHRLSTIAQADTILVLDKGKVIEIGNHKELLDKKGFYYSLYQSQFQ